MDHYMPRIPEHRSLSTNEAEDDNDVSSVSEFSGDDHLNRRLVNDILGTRPQSRHESRFDEVADAERNLTALPLVPLHYSPRIVSQCTSGSLGNPNLQPEKGTKPISRTVRHFFGQACTSCWIWEILALLLSFLALMMIVLILYLSQGRSSLNWPITINSLIAIFSTIMKAALLVPVAASVSQAKWDWFHQQEGQTLADIEIYDQASRGPWGALGMLTMIQWRHFSSLGAIVIVLALAIDPMNQQVISYHQVHHQAQFSTLVISPNTTLPPPPPPPQSWGFTSNSSKIQPWMQMQGAVYSGLFSNSSNDFSSNRSSENSSGQTYQSLAVCHQCSDLTSHLTKRNGNKSCLPDDHCINKADFKFRTRDPGNGGIVNSAFIIKEPCDSERRAGECILYWCLRKYDNSNSPVGQPPSYNDSVSISNYSGDKNIYNMIPADAPQNRFWVDVQSSIHISDWMSKTLSGCAQYQNSPPCPKDKDSDGHSNKNLCDSLEHYLDSRWNPIIAASLGNSSSVPTSVRIDEKFKSIAQAMTDQIQSTPRSNEPMTSISPAQAVTTSQTTIPTDLIMNVQWAWLTLPIALLALAFIFQITTMVRTSRRKTALWKSSTLALFFHGRGVQEGVQSVGGVIMDDIAGMKDVAGRMKVRLENTGRCWRVTEERRRVV